MLINRILIVGLGSIGKLHLQLLRDLLPNADIRVLRHQAGTSVPDVANGIFSSISEAINFKPQIAVIAGPSTTHVNAAQALAEVGVHLLIEKPISASLVGVSRLISTCQQYDCVLITGYNLRHLTSIQRFREVINDGIIGKVLSVRCEAGQYLPTWRANSDYRMGVSARRDLGGGVLLELSHEIDYLRWIFGEVDWVKSTLSRQGGLEIDVEDTAHLTIGFVRSDSKYQLIATLNLDFIRQDKIRQCIAIGDKGSLRWNGLTGQVDLYECGAKDWRELFKFSHDREYSYRVELREFIDCVIQNKKPLITGQDGLRVLQIIEAAKMSAELGLKVSVENEAILGLMNQ